jgi:hypothetical protein
MALWKDCFAELVGSYVEMGFLNSYLQIRRHRSSVLSEDRTLGFTLLLLAGCGRLGQGSLQALEPAKTKKCSK